MGTLQRQRVALPDHREDGFSPLTPPPMLAELARSLVEAGLTLHDCTARKPTGGVCLTPSSTLPGGIIVTWEPGNALARDDSRRLAYRAVRDIMNLALGDILLDLGYDVRETGPGGANVVVGRTSKAGTSTGGSR